MEADRLTAANQRSLAVERLTRALGLWRYELVLEGLEQPQPHSPQ